LEEGGVLWDAPSGSIVANDFPSAEMSIPTIIAGNRSDFCSAKSGTDRTIKWQI
jgi:hypothetical protein